MMENTTIIRKVSCLRTKHPNRLKTSIAMSGPKAYINNIIKKLSRKKTKVLPPAPWNNDMRKSNFFLLLSDTKKRAPKKNRVTEYIRGRNPGPGLFSPPPVINRGTFSAPINPSKPNKQQTSAKIR